MILIFVALGVVAGFVAGCAATMLTYRLEEAHRDELALAAAVARRRAGRQAMRRIQGGSAR